MSKSFGEQLKLLMEQQNLSATKLAKAIGVSPKTVLEWVDRGGRMPRSPDHIKALAEFFKISTHTLLFGEEDPHGVLGAILEKTEIHSGLYEISIKKIRQRGDEK